MSSVKGSSQRGQALILIVVGMVVLLGFTALAVDGSMIYSDRRLAQSVADSASLAGGSRAAQLLGELGAQIGPLDELDFDDGSCRNEVDDAAQAALLAAMQRATDNNFTIDTDVTDNHGVVAECDSVAITPSYNQLYMDVRAVITHDTPTTFAQFIYGGPLRNTNAAVTRVYPPGPFAFGGAIVALNNQECSGQSNGLTSHGGNSLNAVITGGGLWSNGCMDVGGNPNITITGGAATYFYPGPHNFPEGFPDIQLTNPVLRIPEAAYRVEPPPVCTADNRWTPSEILSFHENDLDNGGDGVLDPGLYCITNELRVNNSHAYIEGVGVTFVLSDGMTVNGGTVKLTAPRLDDDSGLGIPGVVIYQPPNITSNIFLNGNEDSYFFGTILAPKSDVTFLGNGDTDLTGQIIGWNVEIGGSPEMNVTYDPDYVGQHPPYIDLYR